MTPPSQLDALIGEVLDDHYRIDELLGAGGMGAVFKSLHTNLQREVAVKVLHPDIGVDPSIAKRFDREAHSASRLDHENCVRVSDFGTTAEGIKYLVMELLEGEELTDQLGEPWQDVDAALEILEQVLRGLDHAHQAGIVHRDLKPENIFMTRDERGRPRAKIVDFGIAKLLDSQGAVEALTRAGMVFGTPRYMSPEQAAGGKVDERSDLYSLGVIAFEMLAGKPPFDSDDLAAILRMQIMAPPPPLPDTVPAEVASFIEQLLEKSRHERPPSASAALERVGELRASLAAQKQQTAPGVSAATDPAISTGGATAPQPAAPERSPDAPLPSKPEAMAGHTVAGRFVLENLLGMGGMGSVFRARDSQTGTLVAVKVLHAAMASDGELAARFEREAETAGDLEHPNIAPVFGHGTTPGVAGEAHYLVMPLLEGVELRDLIKGPLAPERAASLTMQLLAALEHAHARGVIHRDLKPENVFVIHDPSGAEQIQLVDFGLAKVADSPGARQLTRFGQVFGTPAYMSPEQCRGETVDARTDLYAAGVILFELLTGRPPFDDEDPVTLLRKQMLEPPPPLPNDTPPGLRQLVDGLLIKEREARIPDARTALNLLQGALTPADPALQATIPPVGAAPLPPGGAPPAARRTFSRRWLYVGAGVVGLMVIVALWPTGDSGSDASEEDSGEGVGVVANDPGFAPKDDDKPRPPDTVYVEIDRALSAKDSDEALALIRAARDDYPDDGRLLWREGRALALAGGRAKRVTALERYAQAVAADPDLGEVTEFEAELRSLLRDKRLRDTAIDVAVRELGFVGHSFLLEVINDEGSSLGYIDRHRILDEIGRNPAMIARVDLRRQTALDLEQAGDAPAPCTAFADALASMESSDDPYYLDVLTSRSLDVPTTPGAGESTSACTELEVERQRVRGVLAAKYPEAAAKAEKANRRKKKKKGGFPFSF